MARTPQGRRHRPDQGRGGRRMRDRARRTRTTTRGCCARRKPDGQGSRREDRRRLARPGDATARTSTSPAPACSRTRRTARTRSSSSSTSRATTRSAISPTATTSGRWSRRVSVKNPALDALGDVQDRPAADRDARQEHGRGAEDRRPRRLEVMQSSSGRQRAALVAAVERAIASDRGVGLRAPDAAATPMPRQHDDRQQARPATIASDGSAASARRSSLREQVRLRGERVEVERPQDERRRQLLHHVDEHEQQRGRGAAREQRRVHAPQRAARRRRRGCAPRRPSPA